MKKKGKKEIRKEMVKRREQTQQNVLIQNTHVIKINFYQPGT